MKKTINLSDFRDAFKEESWEHNFSHKGLEYLFNYLEELDENWELDINAIDYKFIEYLSEEEIRDDYNIDDDVKVEDFLYKYTEVVCFEENCIIFSQL